MSATLVVLLYHDFCADASDVLAAGNPFYTTTRRRFADQLDRLRDDGFVPMSLARLERIGQGLEPAPGRSFLVTLDGSFRGWTIAADEMHRRSVPAVYYVTTDWVEGAHPYPGEPGTTWAFLRDMAASGSAEIGSHTVTHESFATGAGEGANEYEGRLLKEMVDSKQALDRHLHQDTVHFAPPWGGGDLGLVKRLALQAGYRTIRGTAHRRENPARMDFLDIGVAYGDCAVVGRRTFRSMIRLSGTPNLVDSLFVRVQFKLRQKLNLNSKYKRKVSFRHEA